MRIEHLALNVPDPRAAADWYVANLGMTLKRSGPEPKHVRFIADDAGTMIELYNDEGDDYLAMKDFGDFTFHLAFVCDDVPATSKRLAEAGGTPGPVNSTPAGDQLGFVRCPFGLTIQLVKRAEPMV